MPQHPGAILRLIVLSIGCFLLTACTSQPEVQIPHPTDERTATQALYVVSHGWHTGLIVPLPCLEKHLPSLLEGFEQRDSGWVEVGWGDKGFYQAPEITVALALRAFFASSGAVLHVARPEASVKQDATLLSPREYYAGSEVLELRISDQQMDSLCRFVALSFQRRSSDTQEKAPSSTAQSAQAGPLQPLGKGLYGDSRFYEAIGRYHALHTCNTWTAKGLASAGLDIQAEGTLTARGVMQAVRGSPLLVPTSEAP